MNADNINQCAHSGEYQTQRIYAPNLDQTAVVSMAEYVPARHFAARDQYRACRCSKFPKNGRPFFMDELRATCRITESFDQAANNLS